MWRPSTRAVTGRMPGVQIEADAPVVQEHAEVRKCEVAAEPVGVRLDQRHAHAVAVNGAQICGVAVPPGIPERGCGVPPDGRPARPEAGIVHQRPTVGVLVQDIGAVVAGHARRLHEEVGPERVVFSRQIQALGDAGRRQRQVPL